MNSDNSFLVCLQMWYGDGYTGRIPLVMDLPSKHLQAIHNAIVSSF